MNFKSFWEKTKSVSVTVGKGTVTGLKKFVKTCDTAEEKVFGETLDKKFSRVGKAFFTPRLEEDELKSLLTYAAEELKAQKKVREKWHKAASKG